MASAGASTIGAHQLNFCKSAEEIRSSLRSLISRYEAEVQVTVGVAVDLDQRCFYFSTDGQWDEKWWEFPAFNKDMIPAGREVFPVVSLKGRASFDFGPYWKYKPPSRKGSKTSFNESFFRPSVDVPQIGNSEMLSIYKEVQLHGELSISLLGSWGLKRNVQRLVAARKYRDMNKMQRSFGLRVNKAGNCSGSYKRVGAHCNMPMYRSSNDSTIYYDAAGSEWRMALKPESEEEEFGATYCAASASTEAPEPPRRGWKLPDQERGLLAENFFTKGLESKGLSPEMIQSLTSKLVHQDADGKMSAFRRKGGLSFDDEWAKLENPPCEAVEAWQAGVHHAQDSLLKDFGIEGSHVVESAHPYEAKGFRWTKEVSVKGAAALVVHFYEKSCTYDSSTRLCIFSGGLPRDAAGPGARVELHTCCNQRVWGTVVERQEDRWKVLLDRQRPGVAAVVPGEWPQVGDAVEGKYFSGMYYPAKVASIKVEGGITIYTLDWEDGDVRDKEKRREDLRPRGGGPVPQLVAERNVEDVETYRDAAPKDVETPCFAICREAVKRVMVKYSKQEGPKYDEQGFGLTCGDELLSFTLDRTCPLTPIVLETISDRIGPAKVQGVEKGWYLDLVKTFSGPHREVLGELLNGLGGVKLDLAPVKPDQVMSVVMANLERFVDLLNTKVRAMQEVSLCFIDSSSAMAPVLLPEVHVEYKGTTVSSEIDRLGSDGKNDVVVKSVRAEGPAQAAGVRPGWAVDWPRTLQLNTKAMAGQLPTKEEFMEDPKAILEKPRTLQLNTKAMAGQLPTKEEFMEDPKAILEKSGLKLAFRNLYPVKARQCMFYGPKSARAWRSIEIPGDYCEFEFSSDGDGATFPDQRWGFWALVAPKPPDKEDKIPESFTLEVVKKEGSLLGITTQEVAGACMISGLDTGSTPIQEWNAANPDRALRLHDFILEVNGVKSSYDDILNELRKFQKHIIVAKRSKEAMCSSGHVLKPDPRVYNVCDVCGTPGTQFRCPDGCDYDMCLNCFQAHTSGPVHCPLEDITAFAQKRVQVVCRGEGNQDDPEVERDSWDEQRLRALCARHGWTSYPAMIAWVSVPDHSQVPPYKVSGDVWGGCQEGPNTF